ncbi:MAG: hypothetical protein SGARI_008077, partial [Bacillariaceae sp.]
MTTRGRNGISKKKDFALFEKTQVVQKRKHVVKKPVHSAKKSTRIAAQTEQQKTVVVSDDASDAVSTYPPLVVDQSQVENEVEHFDIEFAYEVMKDTIRGLNDRIWDKVKLVRPNILDFHAAEGFVLCRQDFGTVNKLKIGMGVVLYVTPTTKKKQFSLSTGIPDLFPTKQNRRVNKACWNESIAEEAMRLPDFECVLDLVNSMFSGEYKLEMLHKLEDHMEKVAGELEEMTTWVVEEPFQQVSFLKSSTGLKLPCPPANDEPIILVRGNQRALPFMIPGSS